MKINLGVLPKTTTRIIDTLSILLNIDKKSDAIFSYIIKHMRVDKKLWVFEFQLWSLDC